MKKYILLVFSLLILPQLSFAQNSLPAVIPGQPLPSNLFIELNKVVNPAVVNISTETQIYIGRGGADPMQELFQQFFGFRGTPQQAPPQQPSKSLGTGFIIKEDGLILTNSHVIDNADVINVQLSEKDETKYEAKVIGKDPRTDIALIKITAPKKLPTVKLGSSSDLEVGEWVAAFGNPFGHGHSMTKGIVSAIGRDLDSLNLFPFIQTDASINPGNSGGPLVNTKGQVVGVNTAIDARAQGIGFAIPIDEVKTIVKQLLATGKVSRGFLGVMMETLNEEIAQNLKLKIDSGVLIVNVVEGSAADKAGIRPYDVITKFNNKRIKDGNDLARNVSLTPIGQKVKLEIYRNNKQINIYAQLGTEADDDATIKQYQAKKPYNKNPQKPDPLLETFGMTISDLDAELEKIFEISNVGKHKAVISEVRGYSIASQAGLRAGDVIFEINRQSITSAQEARNYVLKNNSSLLLRVKRGTSFFLARLEKP